MSQLGGAGRRAIAAIGCVAAIAVVLLATGSSVGAQGALPATFSLTGSGRSIPRSFFGVSVEYDQLIGYEREGRLFDRALSLIRPQDGSRMLLRIGGKSADHTFWETT